MSTVEDYSLDNQSFANLRAELNTILAAINTLNSTTSAPGSKAAGSLWLDTTSATTPTLKLYDGSDWISLCTFDYSANTVNWLDSTVSATVVGDTTPQLGGQLDVNGNAIGDGTLELLKFSETGSAVNEFTIANAAASNGPTLSSSGSSDSNIDINIIPAGTGNVNLGADAVQVGDNNADATITTQGTGDLILNTNNGTNSGNITVADGAAGTISITPSTTGVVDIQGSMNPSLSSTGKAMVLGF